jgi:hypothetical protein
LVNVSNGTNTKEEARAFIADLIERGRAISSADADAVEAWRREATRRVQELFPGTVVSAEFNAISFIPSGIVNGIKYARTPADWAKARTDGMASSLKKLALILSQDVELFWKDPIAKKPSPPPPLHTVVRVCDRFSSVATRFKARRKGRNALVVRDEYDVQYILAALLAVHFDDIRTEEPGGSVAGSSSRVDVLLKRERLLVEIKMTRDGLGEKELGKQLIVDIRQYEAHAECNTLVIFVYDPDRRIVNPTALVADLEATQSRLNIRVLVRS